MRVELEKASLYPTDETAAVDIEKFVETHLKVPFDQYAELGPDILGVTEFIPGDKPRVQINRDLTGSALDDDDSPLSILGRWRATVAHEASHVILHQILFDKHTNQPSLFDLLDDPLPTPEPPRVFRSLKRDVSFAFKGGDWREIQANKGMAALLMPKTFFLICCERELKKSPLPPRRIGIGDPAVLALAARLAEQFQVSRQAAAIRLDTLGILAQPGQDRSL
jgi:hypothetical protein